MAAVKNKDGSWNYKYSGMDALVTDKASFSHKKQMKKMPMKKTMKKKTFNAGGNYTKMHKKVFGL